MNSKQINYNICLLLYNILSSTFKTLESKHLLLFLETWLITHEVSHKICQNCWSLPKLTASFFSKSLLFLKFKSPYMTLCEICEKLTKNWAENVFYVMLSILKICLKIRPNKKEFGKTCKKSAVVSMKIIDNKYNDIILRKQTSFHQNG